MHLHGRWAGEGGMHLQGRWAGEGGMHPHGRWAGEGGIHLHGRWAGEGGMHLHGRWAEEGGLHLHGRWAGEGGMHLHGRWAGEGGMHDAGSGQVRVQPVPLVIDAQYMHTQHPSSQAPPLPPSLYTPTHLPACPPPSPQARPWLSTRWTSTPFAALRLIRRPRRCGADGRGVACPHVLVSSFVLGFESTKLHYIRRVGCFAP